MSAPISASSAAADRPEVARVRVTQISLAIIAAVFGYLLIYHLHHERQGHGHFGDFPTFYEAAQFAREHRDIYKAGNAATDQTYVYPPLIAFAYGPLTHLSLANAAAVMLFVTAAQLLGGLFLGGAAILERLHPIREGEAPAEPRFSSQPRLGGSLALPKRRDAGTLFAIVALACLLGENEMRGVMTMIETDSLMLLMFALAFWWLDRRPVLAGLALGLAFNIKYLSIVMLPYLVLRRRWSAVVGMLLGCVAFALLPALQLGWHEDLRCLRVSMGGLLRWVGVAPEASGSIKVHDIADGLSVSITSGLARVLHPHGLTNAQVMVVAAAVGVASLLTVALLYRINRLPLWIWPARNGQRRQPFRALVALEWVGLVTVAIAFSPDTNARHLVLVAFVNLLGAALLLVPRRGVSRVSAGVGLALIVLAFIAPFAKQLRQIGFNHYVWSVPCWCLLIGYLLVLWTGLRFAAQAGREGDATA
ncbi:MAG TPA: glycosyltransferase family 87 protein [Tepidisphaeraceae bacterium]|jgi:hypothetical protein